MISLLPPEHAANIRYGRHNAKMINWLTASAAATVGLLVILGIGQLYVNQQIKGLNKNISLSQTQLAAQDLTKVQQQASEISNNIKTINLVLGQEIRFSELIKQIGAVMPQGAVLSSLSLNKVSGGIDLSAHTTNHSSAAQVAVNLTDPSKNIFDKVDIVSIICKPDPNPYPCEATYRALFTKTIPSKFLGAATSNGGAQ